MPLYHHPPLRWVLVCAVLAPLATAQSANPPAAQCSKPLYLTLKDDLRLFIGDQPVERAQLGQALDQQTQAQKDTTIFFRADKHVEYAELMAAMNELRAAGYLKVGLVGLETVAPR